MRNVLLDFKGEIQSLDLKSHTEIFCFASFGNEASAGATWRRILSWEDQKGGSKLGEGGGAVVGRKMTT